MQYTDIINTIRTNYRLEPQDVFFAILAANGCGRAESYFHIFMPNTDDVSKIRNMANKHVKENPALERLIIDLQDRRSTIPLTAELPSKTRKKAQDEEERRKSGWNLNESAEENLKRIMQENLWKLGPEEKIRSAKDLAKLFGISVENGEPPRYYLPLSCRECSLYAKAKALKESNKDSKEGKC